MDHFPKIVASFIYTGPMNRLRTRLGGAILDAIRPEVLALRPVAELEEKIKIVEFADGTNRWEYYPKVSTTRSFTEVEFVQVEEARVRVVAILQSALVAEGATSIVVHSSSILR